MKIIKLSDSDPVESLAGVENVLRRGGIAVVPTDTVYGIVCDGLSDSAKHRIYETKRRCGQKPLIGFVDNAEKIKRFAEVPSGAESLLAKCWPGATTFVMQGIVDLPYISSEAGKVAFRIPACEFVLSLASKFTVLASTSANISGEKVPCSVAGMPESFRSMVDIIVDGGEIAGCPSTIWDISCRHPKLIRGRVLFVCEGNSCRSPMAEAFLKQALRSSTLDVKVESAGVRVLNKCAASFNAREVMQEAGICIRDFASRQIEKDMIHSADMIFVMEPRHKQSVLSLAPGAVDKISVLDVPDPAGKDIVYYRQIRDAIKGRVDGIIRENICL